MNLKIILRDRKCCFCVMCLAMWPRRGSTSTWPLGSAPASAPWRALWRALEGSCWPSSPPTGRWWSTSRTRSSSSSSFSMLLHHTHGGCVFVWSTLGILGKHNLTVSSLPLKPSRLLLQDLPEIILISCENDLHLCREYFSKNIGMKLWTALNMGCLRDRTGSYGVGFLPLIYHSFLSA